MVNHRMASVILGLLLLTSCTNSALPDPTSSGSPSPVPTIEISDLYFPQESLDIGGYVEDKLVFPDCQLTDDFGQSNRYYAISKDQKILRTNAGFKDWEEVAELKWINASDELKPYWYENFVVTSDEKFLALFTRQSRGASDDDHTAPNQLIIGDQDQYTVIATGDWYRVKFDLPCRRCILFTQNEGVVYDLKEQAILCTIQWKSSSTLYSAYMEIIEDILYQADPYIPCINRYDLTTGEALEPLRYSERVIPEFMPICATNDLSGLLLACSRGIYFLPLEGGEARLLIASKDSYMEQPSATLSQIFQLGDGSILLHGLEMAKLKETYLRYTYDPNKDNNPAADPLSVFSLDENKTLLEAVSIAQQDGMAIEYSVGTDGGVLPDDAIRSLLTQLLAGSGPDLLALDGLPLSQLASKGALLDLQTLLPSGCLDNITASFRQDDGAVFTIPARFFLPTLLGKDISTVSGLPALASWTQSHPYQDLGIGPPRLLPQFFPLYAHSWIVDGKLQEDAFRKDLEALGRLGQMWLDTTVKDHRYLENDPSFLVYQWFSDIQAGAFGWYGSVRSLVQPYSALQQKEGQFLPFGNGVFLPACMMGINAASSKQEQAQAFLSSIFSDKVQGADLQDGFPVLLSSLQAQMDQFEPGTDMGAMEITWNEPYAEAMTMKLNWPAKEDFASLLESMKQLTKAGETDRALQDLLTEGTLSYIRGEQSLDQCLQALKSKLDIYLAE